MPTHEGNDILKDKVIICTYPKKEQDELIEILSNHGATVHSMPVIEICPLPFQLKKNINKYNWLIFTSKNAVQPFADRYPTTTCKIAALGKKTADKLNQHQLMPDFVGTGKSADDFADEFIDQIQRNEKILLILGDLASTTLQQKLGEKAQIDRINIYQTRACPEVNKKFAELVDNDQYNALIVTSPSAVQTIANEAKQVTSLRFISIGKTTSSAIKAFNIEPLATSNQSSYKGLAETTINYFKNKKLKI